MAIWMQFFGEQKVSQNIDTLSSYINKDFRTLKLDFSFLKNNLREMKSYGLFIESKTPKEEYFIYDSKKWEISQHKDTIEGNYLMLFYPLYKNKIHGGLRIIVQKELIIILGDMEHCGSLGLINNKELANGYLKFAIQIISFFKGKKIILCSEQVANTDEGGNSFKDLEKKCIATNVKKVDNIFDINFNNYFIGLIK